MIVATGQPVTLVAISGQAAESPAGTFSVNDATGSGFAGATVASVPAGARWTVTADAGPDSWGLYAYWRTAAGAQTGPTVHSIDPVTGAGTTILELPAKPVDATTARLGIEIRSTGTGRVVQVTAASWTLTATTEMLTGQLERPLHRTSTDRITAAVPHIQSGTPGLLAGQITYLADSLAAALVLDAIYQTPVPASLTTAGDMNGLKHQAVGIARMTAERATPGRPSKWLYTVEIREVP